MEESNFILRQCGVYSKTVDVNRGITQGDIDSPTIFNVIVDVILRMWMIKKEYKDTFAIFMLITG